MSDQNEKPREFWVFQSSPLRPNIFSPGEESVYVIEKSAYDSLAAKLAEVEKLLTSHNLDPREVMSRGLHESRMAEVEKGLLSQASVNKVLSDEVLIYMNERDAALARAEKYKASLNKIGKLSMSGLAYTREFTEEIEMITREALSVPKKWPY